MPDRSWHAWFTAIRAPWKWLPWPPMHRAAGVRSREARLSREKFRRRNPYDSSVVCKLIKLRRIAGIVAGCMLPLAAPAVDTKSPNAPDPDLPQPLDLTVAQPLLASSPFTRAINLSDSITLTGIAYVQGQPVATLTDKRTKENILVSRVPNSRGWSLADAIPSTELRFTSVRILVGPELVTIRYGDAQLAPTTQARYPTDAEALRNDENGKAYVRGSVYLPDADRERYYHGLSREAHNKFREVIRANREMMIKASPEERAAFAKKVFDAVDAEDRARQRR